MKTYKGRYKPKNKKKYVGNIDDVVYRSGWERSVMKWCDETPQVTKWASEEIVVKYLCETDKKPHRYFIDFAIMFKNGRKVLVEVKPHKETIQPTVKGKSKRTILREGMTWVKNQSKWEAAVQYAKEHGWDFEIWDEHRLRDMGLLPKPLRSKKKIAPLRPFKRRKKK